MSNYIKVLKRLEREKRMPAPRPMVDVDVDVAATPAPTPLRSVPPPVAPVMPPPPDLAEAVTLAAPARVVAPEPAVPAEPAVVVHPVAPIVMTRPEAPAPLPEPVTPLPVMQRPTPVPPPAPVAPPTPVVPPVAARRALAPSSHVNGVATLFDNIRVLATGRSTRIVVFAGASKGTAVELVATGLAHHAQRSGSNPFVAELTSTAGRSLLAPVAVDDQPTGAGLPVDLDAGVAAERLHAWIERAAPTADLVILLGPPLATSIDAALLAGACDGLVIVAESEVTERAALQTAAERARVAGCRTLGVVMHGTKDRLPSWMQRLMGSGTAPHS